MFGRFARDISASRCSFEFRRLLLSQSSNSSFCVIFIEKAGFPPRRIMRKRETGWRFLRGNNTRLRGERAAMKKEQGKGRREGNNEKSSAPTYHREISTPSETGAGRFVKYRGPSFTTGSFRGISSVRPGLDGVASSRSCCGIADRAYTTTRLACWSCRCRYIGPYIMHNIKTSPVVSRRAFNRVSLPSVRHPRPRVATYFFLPLRDPSRAQVDKILLCHRCYPPYPTLTLSQPSTDKITLSRGDHWQLTSSAIWFVKVPPVRTWKLQC